MPRLLPKPFDVIVGSSGEEKQFIEIALPQGFSGVSTDPGVLKKLPRGKGAQGHYSDTGLFSQ